jgi:hypothetical protein
MRDESKPETQRAHQLLSAMNVLSQDPDDLFLMSMGTDALYAQYFGKRRAVPLRAGETDFSMLRIELSEARKKGKRLYIETDLLDMINRGKHPSAGVLTELIDLSSSSTRGADGRGFKLIEPISTREKRPLVDATF